MSRWCGRRRGRDTLDAPLAPRSGQGGGRSGSGRVVGLSTALWSFGPTDPASRAANLRCRVMIRAAATGAALDRLVGLVVDDLTVWPGLVLNKPPFGLSVVGTRACHNVDAYRPFARSGQCVNDALADDVPHLPRRFLRAAVSTCSRCGIAVCGSCARLPFSISVSTVEGGRPPISSDFSDGALRRRSLSA
jgi:hypothetical protein